jgi:hypothetical protein
MAYIEDYLKEFYLGRIRTSQYDTQIATSLGSQAVMSGRALTEKQGQLAIRLLDKYKQQFLSAGFKDILEDIKSPNFKKPFRIVENKKTVFIEDNKISIKFPFDQTLVTALREISNLSTFCKPSFDGEAKLWRMELNEDSLSFVENNLIPKEFEISSEIMNLIEQIQVVRENMEDFVPILVKNHEKYEIKNSIVHNQYDNLLEAVIDSVKKSILVFDEKIYQELEEEIQKNPVVKLLTMNSNSFLINNQDHSKEQLISLIKKFNTTVAVFFEDDVTPETLIQWYESLLNSDVKPEEIAVYFRKNSDNDNGFNQLIKNLGLNKEAHDEKVKWMFLSSKYPKSLFKSGKIADICVMVDRHISTHYTTINIANNSLLHIRYANKNIASLESSYNKKRGEKIVVL